jgi:hypothetical protein
MDLIEFQQKVVAVHDDIVVLNYQQRDKPARVRHAACENEYDIMPRVLLTGCKCPYCVKSSKTKSHEDFEKKVAALTSGDYVLLPEPRWVSSSQKVRLRHESCGHEYDVKPQLFINGRRCAVCARKKKRTQEVFETQVLNAVGTEYAVLGTYINGETPITMRHVQCGHEWNVRPANFLNRATRCPMCCTISTRSRGHEMVKGALERLKIVFDEEARIVRSPETGRFYAFDFFIPSSMVAIEFDGKTHFEETRFYKRRKEGLAAQQRRDVLKTETALESGISILRIDHTLTNRHELVQRVIRHFLQEVTHATGTVISSEASLNGANVQRLSKALLREEASRVRPSGRK